MSQENVEIVRRIYASWGQGDFRASAPLFDAHAVLVLRPEFPDAGTYHGPAEIRKYTQELLTAWEDFSITGEEFTDAGDSVVVRVHQRGIGAGSGLTTEIRYFQVWTFRGRSVIRMENIREGAEALEAVGLRE